MAATPQLGSTVNEGAFQGVNRAIVEAGNEIRRSAAVVGNIALQKQELVNRGIIASDALKRRKIAAQIETQLSSPEMFNKPEQWEKVVNDTWAGYERDRDAQAKAEGWGQAVVDESKIQGKAGLEEWRIQVGVMRSKSEVQKANTRQEALAVDLMNSGDEAGARKALEGMVLFPEQREQKWKQVVFQSVRNDMIKSPGVILDALQEKDDNGNFVNYKDLDGQDRYSLIDSATGMLNKQRAALQDEISGRSLAGEPFNPSEVQSWVDGKMVTASWAKSFLKAQDKAIRGEAGVAKDTYVQVKAAIAAYDPARDGDSVRAEILAGINLLPDGFKQDAKGFFDEKAKPDSSLNSPAAKTMFGEIEELFKIGAFGQYKVEDDVDPTKKKEDPKLRTEAFARRSMAEDKMRDFFKRNPTATQADAAKAFASIKDEVIVGQLTGGLRTSGGTSAPATLSDLDRAARLSTILGNGK